MNMKLIYQIGLAYAAFKVATTKDTKVDWGAHITKTVTTGDPVLGYLPHAAVAYAGYKLYKGA